MWINEFIVLIKQSLVLICKWRLTKYEQNTVPGWNILRTTVSVVVLILNEICIQ